jgi:hypothetical protein
MSLRPAKSVTFGRFCSFSGVGGEYPHPLKCPDPKDFLNKE